MTVSDRVVAVGCATLRRHCDGKNVLHLVCNYKEGADNKPDKSNAIDANSGNYQTNSGKEVNKEEEKEEEDDDDSILVHIGSLVGPSTWRHIKEFYNGVLNFFKNIFTAIF